MTFLQRFAAVSAVCLLIAAVGVRVGGNVLTLWYPALTWGSLVYLSVVALRMRRQGTLQASITSAANVIQAFGICSMITGIAAGLFTAVAGGTVNSIAELPVSKVLAPFIEGLVSMGLGILLSVAVQFGDDEGVEVAPSLTVDRIADRIGVGPTGSFEEFEKLRKTIHEANGAAESLRKNLSDASVKAGDAARQFSEVIINVARLVEDLNRFFPEERRPNGQ